MSNASASYFAANLLTRLVHTMESIEARLARLDWAQINNDLDLNGYAVIPDVLDEITIARLGAHWDASLNLLFDLSENACGSGKLLEIRDQELPDLGSLRSAIYCHVASTAERWCKALSVENRYLANLTLFQGVNSNNDNYGARSYLSKLGPGDYISLRDGMKKSAEFPIKLIGSMAHNGRDFIGGEVVIVEQRPRMQSRARVITLRKGDIALVAISQRPVKGTQSYYSVTAKHAISRIESGNRFGIELSLDAW